MPDWGSDRSVFATACLGLTVHERAHVARVGQELGGGHLVAVDGVPVGVDPRDEAVGGARRALQVADLVPLPALLGELLYWAWSSSPVADQ